MAGTAGFCYADEISDLPDGHQKTCTRHESEDN
jgi:hypothetical protein